MLGAVRPHAWDFPLFLHVFGAMALFGTTLAACGAAWVGRRAPFMANVSLWSLAAAIPAWVLMRGGAQWTYSKEGFTGHGDPSWLGVGFGVGDAGLLVLLLALGFAFSWARRNRPIAGLFVTGLSTIYLALLAIAWLAMSGKWG